MPFFMRVCATLLVLSFSVLTGCSNPKSTVIPKDVSKWDTELKPAIEKLADEEKGLFAGYLMRAKLGEAFGGGGIPDGMTVGKAIETQKEWIAKTGSKDKESKALREKLEQERLVLRKQVDELLTVTVLSLKIEPADFQSGKPFDRQMLKLGFQNKGKKDILGVMGSVHFIDIFDKDIGSVSFKYDDGIKAGATATWSGGRRYNEFLPEHRAIAGLSKGKYMVKFEPEMVIFADGSKLEVKE